jgi:hypothetical protein
MNSNGKSRIIPLTLAGLWITLSEFLRNEILFKSYWVAHYAALGLHFETLPLNGILWTAWSFGLAFLIQQLLRKFTFAGAVGLAWLAAFALMWITAYNLQVLPLGLLFFAVPLSGLEVAVAAVILRRSGPRC